MKKILIVLILLKVPSVLLAQEHAWIYFTDKENVTASINNPLTILTSRAIDRKTKHNISIDERDVPLNESYKSQIELSSGIEVKAKSKWFNAVHVIGSQSDINELLNFDFVASIDFADDSMNMISNQINHSNNKFEIENYWKELMELNSIKKSDILLKVKNDKTQDKIIYYLKSLLKQIGVDIQSPQNKKRDNDLYKITYDNKHIYQDVVQKPKTRDIRIKNDILSVNGLEYKLLNNRNKIITDVVSKSNTIKASIKKIINIDGKNDINSYNIVNWKRKKDDGEWKKDSNSIVYDLKGFFPRNQVDSRL